MSAIVILAGSPSLGSRTVALTEHLAGLLRADGHDVRLVRVRELPAEALLGANTNDPAIAEVVKAIADADGLVVASGVYKAAYSGVLRWEGSGSNGAEDELDAACCRDRDGRRAVGYRFRHEHDEHGPAVVSAEGESSWSWRWG